MNPNNPKRLKILELVQEANDHNQPIKRYSQLAEAIGITLERAQEYVLDWEFRGRLVRSQRGELHVLAAANDEQSGVHNIRPLTQAEIEEARAASKRPKRAQRPVGWLRQIILGESDKMLEGAAPDNPELGKQIAEATTLAERLNEKAARAPRPERAPRVPKPKPLRSSRETLPELVGLAPLPMPKPMPEPARRWQDEHQAAALALEVAAEASLKLKMERQALREEQQVPVTKFCPRCLEMPWRRPKDALCRCGRGFEPEQVEISLERQSSIALCEG